ncbi:MAG: undecaprenyl-diphosphate phosphatase [Patescibacteria group bacterium]
MSFLSAIILGIIEGITEFLPISSTGHLILFSKFLSDSTQSINVEFIKNFEVFIQFGAIFSVIILYWHTLKNNFDLIKKVLFAFIPTAVVGFILYDFIKRYLFSEHVVLWSLFVGGLALIIFELMHKEGNAVEKLEDISYKKAFLVGIFQSIAIIPGVSRAAATIVGGMLLGFQRKTIVEFSFLLAVPTMAAASGLVLFKNINQFSANQFNILGAGFITSFIVAILTIKLLLKFIKHHTFINFGVYRIFLAIIFWLLITRSV